jgi:hypothetical protein
MRCPEDEAGEVDEMDEMPKDAPVHVTDRVIAAVANI